MAQGVSKTVAAIAALRRWSEDDARVVLEAARRSGRTLGSFATSAGIEPQRLDRWSRVLGDRVDTTEAVRFEEVVVRRAADADLELALASGHVIRLSASFDAEALRRVLAVLAEVEREC